MCIEVYSRRVGERRHLVACLSGAPARQDLLLIVRRRLLPSPSRSRLRALVRRSRAMAAQGAAGGEPPTLLRAQKPIVLVLGSGWAAHALIKARRCVHSQAHQAALYFSYWSVTACGGLPVDMHCLAATGPG